MECKIKQLLHNYGRLTFQKMFLLLFSNIDIGTWKSLVELNLGTNQINKLPDDIAELQSLEVSIILGIKV